MEKITVTKEELQTLIRDAVKQEIETSKLINKKESSPYIFQGILNEYIKDGGKLSDVVGTRVAWKFWETCIRKTVVTAMGKAYVRDIEDTEKANELARNLIEVLIDHYKSIKGAGNDEWCIWNTNL